MLELHTDHAKMHQNPLEKHYFTCNIHVIFGASNFTHKYDKIPIFVIVPLGKCIIK